MYGDTKIEDKNIAPLKIKSSLERSNVKSEFKRVKRQGNTASNLVILSTDQYLTHYWPFENGTMKDIIGSADMIQGNLTSFTMDRFGNVNSALALSGGWTHVPAGIYFDSPEFTISVWVFPINVGSASRIVDFANGPQNDNIIFTLATLHNLQPLSMFYSGSNTVFSTISAINISLNQWQFLASTFNGTNARVYLNGTLVGESNTQNYTQPFNIWRNSCYIGKSNWNGDGYSHSYLDDLRFYNKSLTQEEILESMHYNKSKINLFSKITFILNLIKS